MSNTSLETQGLLVGTMRYFWRESLFQGLKSPWASWALFLTKRVPEVVEIRPLIGQKMFFFWPINEEV